MARIFISAWKVFQLCGMFGFSFLLRCGRDTSSSSLPCNFTQNIYFTLVTKSNCGRHHHQITYVYTASMVQGAPMLNWPLRRLLHTEIKTRFVVCIGFLRLNTPMRSQQLRRNIERHPFQPDILDCWKSITANGWLLLLFCCCCCCGCYCKATSACKLFRIFFWRGRN